MRRAAVFVLSDVRSGSTLLDQCLGAHPEIMSLGEVHWLPAYVAEDRTMYDPAHPLVCTCGAPVERCSFWGQVAARLACPLGELRLRADLKNLREGSSSEPLLGRAAKWLVKRNPGLLRHEVVRNWFEGDAVARDVLALFEAVASVSGCSLCVDSSKSSFRFRAVYGVDPSRTRAIVLVRDFRAVVQSKMKRGLSFEAAAQGWRRKMEEIEALTSDLPAGVMQAVRYEEFCLDPGRELEKLCEFLGVEFSNVMLERPKKNVHHIGGSPSKFDDSKTRILLDRAFETSFGPQQVRQLRQLIGPVAERWGY